MAQPWVRPGEEHIFLCGVRNFAWSRSEGIDVRSGCKPAQVKSSAAMGHLLCKRLRSINPG
jgi:hypothetical protein